MKLVKLLGMVIVVLLIGNVVLANTAVDESLTVKAVSAEIEALEQRNLNLKQTIAKEGSLQQISLRLEASGYVTTPRVVTLNTTSAVALR